MGERFNRRDLLEAIFGQILRDRGHFILVKSIDDRWGKVAWQYFPSIDKLADLSVPEDRDVFFGVCPREKMKLEKEHIRYITTLWAGLDVGPAGYSGTKDNFSDYREALAAVNSFRLKPSIVVRSGRGMHLYWLLSGPRSITNALAVENLLEKLNEQFLCKSHVGIDSVMRLPGTWNPRAYPGGVRCYVESLDPEARYSPKDFQFALGNGARQDTQPYEVLEIREETPEPTTASEQRQDVSIPLSEEGKLREAPDVESALEPWGDQTEDYANLWEPSEYELSRTGEQKMVMELSDRAINELAETVAERIAQRILRQFSSIIVGGVVDRAVDKLVERLCLPTSTH